MSILQTVPVEEGIVTERVSTANGTSWQNCHLKNESPIANDTSWGDISQLKNQPILQTVPVERIVTGKLNSHCKLHQLRRRAPTWTRLYCKQYHLRRELSIGKLLPYCKWYSLRRTLKKASLHKQYHLRRHFQLEKRAPHWKRYQLRQLSLRTSLRCKRYQLWRELSLEKRVPHCKYTSWGDIYLKNESILQTVPVEERIATWKTNPSLQTVPAEETAPIWRTSLL